MIHPLSTGKYRIYCSKEYHEVYKVLKDGERAKEFIQDYADGGMEIFLKSEVMKRFVTKKDDMVTLDFSENDHLPKQVMYYVYSLYQDFQKTDDIRNRYRD